MDKTDDNTLTNQPETVPIASQVLSWVDGCWGVVEKAVFDVKQQAEMNETEVFVFGRVGGGGAKSAEVEAAMADAVVLALTLGVGATTAARGRLKSRQLLRYSRRFSRRWGSSWFFVHFALCL